MKKLSPEILLFRLLSVSSLEDAGGKASRLSPLAVLVSRLCTTRAPATLTRPLSRTLTVCFGGVLQAWPTCVVVLFLLLYEATEVRVV